MYQYPIICVDIVHDQDCQLAYVQTYLGRFLHDSVGVGGQSRLSEECEGVGSNGPEGASGGIGAELKRQDGGKGWRIEEGGDRKGGSGLDSSAESLGMEGIDRSRSGGIGTEEFCGLRCSCCGGMKGSFCGGSSIDNKSHMQMFLDTIIDVRRMYESKYIYKS